MKPSQTSTRTHTATALMRSDWLRDPRLVSLALWLAFGALALVWLAFFLWQPPDPRLDGGITVNATENASSRIQPAAGSDFNLFGRPNQATAAASAPVSQLELRLTGTMAGDDPKSGLAFIDNKQGQQKSFAVGDAVFGLAELVAIYPDYVILRHNGREEKIPMARPGQFANGTTRQSRSNARATQPAALPGIRGNKPTTRAQQAQLDAIRQKYLVDPEEIAKSIQVVPITEGGKVGSGLRVSALRQGTLLQRAGLKSNDLITAINGKAISPTNMMSLARDLEGASQVTVTVRRNGRNKTLQLDLSALKAAQ